MAVQEAVKRLAHVSITEGDGCRSPSPKNARVARRNNHHYTETNAMPVMNYEEWIAAKAISGQQPEQINGLQQRNLLYTAGTASLTNNQQHFQMMGAVSQVLKVLIFLR